MPFEQKDRLMPSRFRIALLWAALIGLDTAAQLLFKFAAQGLGAPDVSWRWLHLVAQSPGFWAATIAISLTFPIWMVILRSSQISLAFPATALTYVGVIGGSQLAFGESIGTLQYAGILLILVGVALLRRPNR